MDKTRRALITKLPLLFAFPDFNFHYSNYDIVLRELPRSKPYLSLIEESREKYRNIFHVPLEVIAYHVYLESGFSSNAFSQRLAVGICQFKRETAKEVGIEVYDDKKYFSLYRLEQKVEENFSNLSLLEHGDNKKDLKGFINLFYADEFKEAERLKIRYNKLKTRNHVMVEKFKREFFKHAEDKSFDKRLNPEISIDRCCYLLANLCKLAEDKFHGKKEHNIIRGIACYNYGRKALEEYGLPLAKETINHIRKIIAFSDKVSLA